MSKKINCLLEHIIMIVISGIIYYGIEILWRGYSHWTMFIVGGIAGFLIGEINHCVPWSISIVGQMVLSTIIVTIIEFVAGCIINIWLGWNVWSYILLPYNLYGQICLLYVNLWFLLSFPVILLDDWIRWKLFKEPIQKYKWL